MPKGPRMKAFSQYKPYNSVSNNELEKKRLIEKPMTSLKQLPRGVNSLSSSSSSDVSDEDLDEHSSMAEPGEFSLQAPLKSRPRLSLRTTSKVPKNPIPLATHRNRSLISSIDQKQKDTKPWLNTFIIGKATTASPFKQERRGSGMVPALNGLGMVLSKAKKNPSLIQ